ncbi:hypothetical protein EMIHUDRAFT_41564, partial [Emiliania huxleyi CCMP1516]|uniref:MORN repeat-containing protein n=2 Tax=Emiliania huxleyi TaxID=2903 RepID=A0A0D3KUN3_EMIH1
VFQGSFTLGRRGGERSSLTFQDGDRLVGSWSADGEFMEGTVRHTYTNGDAYDGGWRTTGIAGQKRGPGGGSFSGRLQEGKRTGGGVLHCSEGRYEGRFAGDEFEGEGNFVSADGTVEFRGSFARGRRHGPGYELRRGENGGVESFEGEWVEGERRRGILTAADGSKTKGTWANGCLDEALPVWRSCTIGDGSHWEGGWVGGQPHGKGVLKSAQGASLRGTFAKGALCPDKAAHADSVPHKGGTFDGSWRAGAPHGRGRLTYTSGAQLEGEWRGGEAHSCRGTLLLSGGHRFDGQVRSGAPDGRGSMRYANGARFEGTFRAGAPEDHGICFEPDGRRYEGQWHGGLRHGHG